MIEILNLRKTKDGYLANGYIPLLPNNEQVLKWIEEDNEVLPMFTDVEITEQEIKAKVPKVITMRQARLQLLTLGLLDDVEAVIASIQDTSMKRVVQIEWEYAKDVERNSPTIGMLAQAVGMNDEALDNLFIEAVKL